MLNKLFILIKVIFLFHYLLFCNIVRLSASDRDDLVNYLFFGLPLNEKSHQLTMFAAVHYY